MSYGSIVDDQGDLYLADTLGKIVDLLEQIRADGIDREHLLEGIHSGILESVEVGKKIQESLQDLVAMDSSVQDIAKDPRGILDLLEESLGGISDSPEGGPMWGKGTSESDWRPG